LTAAIIADLSAASAIAENMHENRTGQGTCIAPVSAGALSEFEKPALLCMLLVLLWTFWRMEGNALISWLMAMYLLGAPNPVLPHTADAGLLRHDGKYYLMGVGTDGSLFVSDDLVHWSGPQHAFSMENAWTSGSAATDDNIHACDLLLHNGLFHLYWSVNHGELRQIGHAVAKTPEGPYHEPVREIPFDGRIDPQCFQDDDGRLYFYTVKFGFGNAIWGQPMTSPWKLADKPIPLLTAVRDSWETADKPKQFINEGPFTIKYRGRYYMMYNANHTSPQYGNYALGVAESDGPLNFNNGGKYRFPVLRSNLDPRHAGITIDPKAPETKNCGQPNLVRGPNGIEWWLLYFADRGARSQCIDRVHFFGHELFMEGPTTAAVPGYHPVPALPTFRDFFEDAASPVARWNLEGNWQQRQGALHVCAETGEGCAQPRVSWMRNYVLETTLQYREKDAGRLGVVAWDNGHGTRLLIGIDRAKDIAFQRLSHGQRSKEHRVPLPRGFNWEGPHDLRIENNAGAFSVYLGALRLDLPEEPISKYSPGLPALFASGCSASFGSFSLTRGWDEWGRSIRGWTSSTAGLRNGNTGGLVLQPHQSAFKGDPLRYYEFTVQTEAKKAGGVYAVYVNEGNYLMVLFDADFTRIVASGKRHDRSLPEVAFVVHPRIHRAHDVSANGNNLRVVKRKGGTLLFAEGLELGEIEGDWPESRVGLFAANNTCAFDGLTLFEIP